MSRIYQNIEKVEKSTNCTRSVTVLGTTESANSRLNKDSWFKDGLLV